MEKTNASCEDPAEIPPAKRICLYHLEVDHAYQLTALPRKHEKELDETKEQMISLKSSALEIPLTKSQIRVLENRLQCSKKKQLIPSACEQILNPTFSGAPLGLTRRITSEHKSGKGVKYRPQLRSLALTLQFYSPKHMSLFIKPFNLPFLTKFN